MKIFRILYSVSMFLLLVLYFLSLRQVLFNSPEVDALSFYTVITNKRDTYELSTTDMPKTAKDNLAIVNVSSSPDVDISLLDNLSFEVKAKEDGEHEVKLTLQDHKNNLYYYSIVVLSHPHPSVMVLEHSDRFRFV